MLTKILVTSLIIAACYFYLRYQRDKQQSASGSNGSVKKHSGKPPLSLQVQWVAGSLVVLTICAVVGFFIYGWLDNRSVLTVKITSPLSGEITTYQVYKGDMEERSFETLQGQLIRVGDSERIEVSQATE